MKKISLTILSIVIISFTALAQKGSPTIIGIGPEIAFPTGAFGESFKTGFGAWVKMSQQLGKAGLVTFSTGYTSFTAKGSGSQASARIGILPILAGYQFLISKSFYFEPQLGYASYHARVSYNGQTASDSKGAFTYAGGIGYKLSNIDLGIRYQGGSIQGDNYSNVAIRIGYQFSLKDK